MLEFFSGRLTKSVTRFSTLHQVCVWSVYLFVLVSYSWERSTIIASVHTSAYIDIVKSGKREDVFEKKNVNRRKRKYGEWGAEKDAERSKFDVMCCDVME